MYLLIIASIYFIIRVFYSHFQQTGVQTLNGEISDNVDYAAKTHELQTIIEKQVKLNEQKTLEKKKDFRFIFYEISLRHICFDFKQIFLIKFSYLFVDCGIITVATTCIRFE